MNNKTTFFIINDSNFYEKPIKYIFSIRYIQNIFEEINKNKYLKHLVFSKSYNNKVFF